MLVAAKEGLLVVLAPADSQASGRTSDRTSAANNLGQLMYAELSIAHSYEEAREGLTMAARMRLDSHVVAARDLLIYRVLLRDQPAIGDLVHAVLSPLTQARGGTTAPVRAGSHLSAGPRQETDRLQPCRPGEPVHRARGGAWRQAARVARA